jgi:hypothetical protein
VRGGLEGGKVSPGTGICVSRQCLHAAAVLLAVTALFAPRQLLAQTAPAAPQAPATQAAAPTPAAAPADNTAKPAQPAAEGQGEANGGEEAKINLPGATVQGKRNAFDESDRKLKELQDSLPCTGCDAKPHTHKKLYKRVLDAVGDRVLPTEAPDHSAHDANDKSLDFAKEGNCEGANIRQCTPSNASP